MAKKKKYKLRKKDALDIANHLEKLYQIANSTSSQRSFFLTLFDYADLYFIDPILQFIVKSRLGEQKELDLGNLKDLETAILNEMEIAFLQVKQYILDNKIDDPVITEELKFYEGLTNGSVQTSAGLLEGKRGNFHYILIKLAENKKNINFLKPFVEYSESGEWIAWKYSEHLTKYDEEKQRIGRVIVTFPWYNWDILHDYHEIFLHYEQIFNEYKDKHRFTAIGFGIAYSELKDIIDGKKAKDRIKYFDFDEYKGILQRFHVHIDSLLLQTQRSTKTLEIKIRKMPLIEIKNLEQRTVFQKTKNNRIKLRSMPEGLKWTDIEIRFLNGDDVLIKTKSETWQTNSEEMGFADERKKQPDKQWKFLQLLAMKQGEISWGNNSELFKKERENIKKRKQLLADGLKIYFQLPDDPFYSYRNEKAYKIKLKLIPEQGETTEVDKNKELVDSFEKENPSVVENNQYVNSPTEE